MIPGQQNAEIEDALTRGPDELHDALFAWRKATLERERTESGLYTKFKGQDKGRTADEIKALVRADGERYAAVLVELTAEAEHTRVYERLLAAKKLAGLRTAF